MYYGTKKKTWTPSTAGSLLSFKSWWCKALVWNVFTQLLLLSSTVIMKQNEEKFLADIVMHVYIIVL